MTELICEWCFCLALAMQHGGNCHQCKGGTQDEFLTAARSLRDKQEWFAGSCYPKGDKPIVDFKKQGPIVPWKPWQQTP